MYRLHGVCQSGNTFNVAFLLRALGSCVSALFTLYFCVVAGDAVGCALAPRAGEAVHVAEESAVIVWDAATRTQHFVRRAVFDTQAKDFGFLVPTPNRPTLAEADDATFDYLVQITRPPPRAAAPAGESAKGAQLASVAAPVRVLEMVTVAGLDAAVLAASDAGALDRWLHRHGYVSNPDLKKWFEPYVAAKWIITAFKIAKGEAQARRASTSAVRMSFRTERPFFPYREPPSPQTGYRALEIFVLSHERVDGRLGAGVGWPGQALWSKPLLPEQRRQLVKQLRLADAEIPANAWLTRFVDGSTQRPGSDDLYFARSSDSSELMDAAGVEEAERRKAVAAAHASQSISARELGDSLARVGALEREGNYREAIRVLRRAARAGSGKAALLLGDYYDKGRPGVARDYAESLQWYETAARLEKPVGKASKR